MKVSCELEKQGPPRERQSQDARPRVLIDARMLLGRFSGVARFVTRLVERLSGGRSIKVVALCGSEPYEPWVEREDIAVVVTSFDRQCRTPLKRAWWEQAILPTVIRNSGVDLFHATWNSGIPSRCPVPSVLTLHDLIPWNDPTKYFATAMQRMAYHYAIRSSVRRASATVAVSRYVRSQILETLGADPRCTLAIPNGVDAPEETSQELQRQTPAFALYVGGHEHRKNLEGVFHVLRVYREKYGQRLRLKLTGSAETLTPPAKKALAELPSDLHVEFVGHLTDEHLKELYRSASVLLFLSREEGFGLPVLEAMASGCPVIAAGRASIPEVVGEAGFLVDPDDYGQAAEALWGLMTDADLRRRMVDSGLARAAEFSWAETAKAYASVYERVLSNSFCVKPARFRWPPPLRSRRALAPPGQV